MSNRHVNVLVIVVVALLGVEVIPASAPAKDTPHAHATTPKPVLGSKAAPATVEVSKIASVEISTVPMLRVETTDRTPPPPANYFSPEWLLAAFTAMLAMVTGGLAVFPYKLYRATVELSREAKESAEQQTRRMERSIEEAAKAAVAMDKLATATSENTKLLPELLRKQMRAYLSVESGGATYQDANLRFGARPVVTNNGLTPAKNVRWAVLAAIVDGRDATTTVFPNVGPLPESDMGFAPRQTYYITNAVVPDRVPDEDVAGIMEGLTRRLYCWGKVTYDDVYGGSWETNFCVNYTFFRKQDGEVGVSGWVYPRNNGTT